MTALGWLPQDPKKKARMERFGDVKAGLSPEEIAKYVTVHLS